MTLLQLLFSFLQIGLLSIGGGYAALPIIQDQVVAMHGWLSMREFADILTISQMTPGPIAIRQLRGDKDCGASGSTGGISWCGAAQLYHCPDTVLSVL